MTVFVASDVPLPLLPFDAGAPAFHIDLPLEEAEPVRRHLPKPLVYRVSASSGCGCGFAYSRDDLAAASLPDVPEAVREGIRADHDARRASVRRLREARAGALSGGGVPEVYSCWWGDWAAEPESRRSVPLSHFGGRSFRLHKRELLTVSVDSEGEKKAWGEGGRCSHKG